MPIPDRAPSPQLIMRMLGSIAAIRASEAGELRTLAELLTDAYEAALTVYGPRVATAFATSAATVIAVSTS